MATEPETTAGYSREEMRKVAGCIGTNLRWFVEDADQYLSGLECEYLIQVAQFLEKLK